jgi:hypothetical protein
MEAQQKTTITTPESIRQRAQRIVNRYHKLLSCDRPLADELATTHDGPLDVAQCIVAGIDPPIPSRLDAQFAALEAGLNDRLYEAAA